MSKIYAKKTLGGNKGAKKTVARSFNKESWNRMGKEKGGWEVISEAEFQKMNPPKKKVAAQAVVNKPLEVVKLDKVEKVIAPVVVGITDITAADVALHLKTLKTVKEIDDYVGDDKRKNVAAFVAARKEEIEAK